MNAGLSILSPSPMGDGEPEGLEPLPPQHPEQHHVPSPRPGVITLRGSTVSVGDQAHAALWMAWRNLVRRCRDLREQEGSLLHKAYTDKPESIAEMRAYARSRAWVPSGHENGIAETAGVIFYATIAPAGMAFGNAVSRIFSRQISFYIALVFVIPVTVIIVIALIHLFA